MSADKDAEKPEWRDGDLSAGTSEGHKRLSKLMSEAYGLMNGEEKEG